MKMTSKETKSTILSEILESNTFQRSTSYKKLLSYLVTASINEEPVKEYSIAIDVFGKGPDFNPGIDSTVRVYIGNLRKKLDRYYKDEAAAATIRLSIPKGHYDVQFEAHEIKSSYAEALPGKNQSRKQQAFFFVIAMLSLLVLFLIYQNNSLSTRSTPRVNNAFKSKIWTSIIDSDFEKLVVVGDDFFFREKDQGKVTITRRHEINSPAEFKRYQQKHPKQSTLEQTPYPFFPLISVWPLVEFTRSFGHMIDFSLEASSKLKASQLLDRNVIFLGSWRNMYLLNQVLGENDIQFNLGLYGEESFIRVNAPDTTITFTRSGLPDGEHSDYCLVRKVPGPNGNSIIIFVSFFEIGLSGVVHYMADEKKLQNLEELLNNEFGEVPPYFDIIFKTTGHSRTLYKTQIEYMNKIAPDIELWQ